MKKYRVTLKTKDKVPYLVWENVSAISPDKALESVLEGYREMHTFNIFVIEEVVD